MTGYVLLVARRERLVMYSLSTPSIRDCHPSSVAVRTLSSATIGKTMARLAGFDIVFYLSSVGATKADDSPGAPSIHKRHVVEDSGAWGESGEPGLSVLEPVVDPDQRGLPV